MDQQPPQNQGIYTAHGLAELANDPNVNQAQLLQHLQQNHEAVQLLQQQMNAILQQQVGQTNLQATLKAFAANQQEMRTIYEASQLATQQVLERLATRSNATPRLSIPSPLTPKFKAEDAEMTFAEFKAKLSTAFARFPESLSTDKDKINYAILSMEGPPSRYLAPFINGLAEDDDGILLSYVSLMNTLEAIYGDQTQIDEVNYKLQRLRQSGSMVDYIATFRSLSSRVQWNEPALVARFKDGLSDEVKLLLAAQWHSLKTIKATQAAATTAYLNSQAHNRFRGRFQHKQVTPMARKSHMSTPQAPSSGPAPMDLDSIKTRRLTPDEKQRRRDQGLCLYCGEGNHFAQSCPKKKIAVAAIVAESENDSA